MAKRKSRKTAKIRVEKVDGLGPAEIKNLVRVIRQVWSWSHARKLCIARAKLPHKRGEDPMSKCETCGRKVPKVYADHIKPLGAFDLGYIERSFVPSKFLRAVCKSCHQKKTNDENDLQRMLEI